MNRCSLDVDDIEDVGILKVRQLTEDGTPVQLVQQFGGKEPYLKAVRELCSPPGSLRWHACLFTPFASH